MSGAFLDVLDVIESLGCDHDEGQSPQSRKSGAREKGARLAARDGLWVIGDRLLGHFRTRKLRDE
jgi:hypothetical protein